MKKTLYTSLLVLFLFIAQGCGCTSENPPTVEEQPKEVEHIDENFSGPTTEPFSVGPSEPPPSE